MITLTLPDGKKIQLPVKSTGLQAAMAIGPKLAEAALAIVVDGEVRDLGRIIEKDVSIRILTFKDVEGKGVFRNSTAHILAHAIKKLYPEAKPTIGPPVEEGFYYDFDDLKIALDDFPKIEQAMNDIVNANHLFERHEWELADVKKFEGDNPYKVELAEDFKKKGWNLTAYRDGDFIDLCEGPHVPSTGVIKAFKLTKIAGAYWRGDQKNKQLTRIYGISFPSDKELKEHVKIQEEAEARDHKKIGKEMELYMLHELVGKGLPLWLPKGEIIKNAIEQFAIETEDKAGFERVSTPHLAKEELFQRSGHLPHYAESMYPKMVMDDGTYYLKSMNCPLHHLIFGHKPRSYRDLPVRLAEYAMVYRNELSGTLAGLSRVRGLEQNDAHIYCMKEQIADELKAVLQMIKNYFDVFGFKQYHFRLSRWDSKNSEKYINEPDNWEYSEEVLRKVLNDVGVAFIEAQNEAAFYGPKIDVQFKNVYGKEETLSTVQLDFAAKTRFNLFYVDKEGKENNEVFVIHRAPLSSHERFMAHLIEHFAGKFPLWLSPEQVRVLTVAERFEMEGQKLVNKLKEQGIRAHLDASMETINKKVRNAQLDQVNYILVFGEKEMQGQLSVRTRDNKVLGPVAVDAFIGQLKEEIKHKK